MARIRTWQDKKVWPLTETDIQEGKQWGLITYADLVERKNNSDEIRQYMRSNLKKPMPAPVCSYKRHVGARLPLELSEALRALPGTMIAHVLKAVSLYIDAFKEVSGETTFIQS